MGKLMSQKFSASEFFVEFLMIRVWAALERVVNFKAVFRRRSLTSV